MEISVPLDEWPGYTATSEGNILSFKGKARRVLKPHNTNYARVTLRRDGKSCTQYVHKLVMEAFYGPPPPGLEVRHLDNNPFNNRVQNLAYATHSINQLDQIFYGTHKEASKTHCAQGHAYAENTMNPTKNRPNARRCRKCHAIWVARWKQKKRHATASRNELEDQRLQ